MTEKKTILLVEDDVLTLKAQSLALRAAGLEVFTAESGEKAVEVAAGNVEINLVLMDIELGEDMNGMEAARRILDNRNVPIVFLTSKEDDYIDLFSNRTTVKIEKKGENFLYDEDCKSSLGIIVNELLRSMMNYAFTGRKNGFIKISAEVKDGRAVLIIEDNGQGIVESNDYGYSAHFGLKLVDMLSRQIGGNMMIERRVGTQFVLEFIVSNV